MRFSATLRGVAYSHPQEFAAAVKAAPPLEPYSRAGKPVVVPTVNLPPKPRPIFKKPSVTLTTDEKQWLGATVRLADGFVGQVWALHPKPGFAWIVGDGETRVYRLAALEVVR
jgi:hypothetical protein